LGLKLGLRLRGWSVRFPGNRQPGFTAEIGAKQTPLPASFRPSRRNDHIPEDPAALDQIVGLGDPDERPRSFRYGALTVTVGLLAYSLAGSRAGTVLGTAVAGPTHVSLSLRWVEVQGLCDVRERRSGALPPLFQCASAATLTERQEFLKVTIGSSLLFSMTQP
jgi:hypothetical protein